MLTPAEELPLFRDGETQMNLSEIPTAELVAELFRRSEVGLFAVLAGNADAAQAVPTPQDLVPCWVAVHAQDGKRERLAECVRSALPILWGRTQ